MSDVVFILGAGASRDCGGPLMGDFLDIAQDLLLTGRVKIYGISTELKFRQVFESIGCLQRVHSKAQLDLINIESIFTAFELGNVIKKVPGIPAFQIPEIIDALKELIATTLELRIIFPLIKGEFGAPGVYSSFTSLMNYLRNELVPHQSISIITFNYNIYFDMAMYLHDLGPSYVIDSTDKSDNDIELMKLHGSLNWASETESKAIRPLHLSKYFQSPNSPPITEGTDAILPISHYLVDYFQKVGSIKVEARPVIVPPSWNKSDYHQTLSQVWARAADHLSEARHIFVIGYSLPETDSFFRHLYALGSVGDAPLKSFVVFNPENPEGPVDKRFHNLLGHGALARYKYIQTTFSPAINEIRRLLTEHHQILRQHDEIVAQ